MPCRLYSINVGSTGLFKERFNENLQKLEKGVLGLLTQQTLVSEIFTHQNVLFPNQCQIKESLPYFQGFPPRINYFKALRNNLEKNNNNNKTWYILHWKSKYLRDGAEGQLVFVPLCLRLSTSFRPVCRQRASRQLLPWLKELTLQNSVFLCSRCWNQGLLTWEGEAISSPVPLSPSHHLNHFLHLHDTLFTPRCLSYLRWLKWYLDRQLSAINFHAINSSHHVAI